MQNIPSVPTDLHSSAAIAKRKGLHQDLLRICAAGGRTGTRKRRELCWINVTTNVTARSLRREIDIASKDVPTSVRFMLMRDLLEEGLLLFNEGKFYDAHEVWEDLWRATSDPVLKTCYQGLIQAAVGMHHLERRNVIGASSQAKKSIRNLQAGAAAVTGLDIEGSGPGNSRLCSKTCRTGVPRGLRVARLK